MSFKILSTPNHSGILWNMVPEISGLSCKGSLTSLQNLIYKLLNQLHMYLCPVLHRSTPWMNRLKEQSGEKISNNWSFWRTNLNSEVLSNLLSKEHWEKEHPVPWHISNQPLSLGTVTGGHCDSLGTVLCPSCSPGEYPSSGTGICSGAAGTSLTPQCCVCPSWQGLNEESRNSLLLLEVLSNQTDTGWVLNHLCVPDFTAQPTHGPALAASPCQGNSPEGN